MVTLIILGCAGFLSGCLLAGFGIALLSFVLLVTWMSAMTYNQSFDYSDVLIVLSYLAAMQGGYLFGAHLKYNKNTRN